MMSRPVIQHRGSAMCVTDKKVFAIFLILRCSSGWHWRDVSKFEAAVGYMYKLVAGYEVIEQYVEHNQRRLYLVHTRSAASLDMGIPIEAADVELFMRLACVVRPKHIFIVGNAWGYSTILLSMLFRSSAVDAIDAGVEGKDVLSGINLTRQVAQKLGLDVHVFHGFSPQDVPRALRGNAYELVFIDGLHTNRQQVLDFLGIQPFLAKRSVVVFHDIHLSRLRRSIYSILCLFPEMRFAFYHGMNFTSRVGTGFMYNTDHFADKTFSSFHKLGIPYRCKMSTEGSPEICMNPQKWYTFKLDVEVPSLCADGVLDGISCCPKFCGTDLKHVIGLEASEDVPETALVSMGPGLLWHNDRMFTLCCHRAFRAVECTDSRGPPPCVYAEHQGSALLWEDIRDQREL